LTTPVTWKQGEFSDEVAIAETITGADAVCCVFGPRMPTPAIFCAPATRAVVAAMQAVGVRRLVGVTGAMIGEYPANRTLIFGILRALLLKRFGEMFRDRESQEAIIRASGLDWTLFKPPRLTDGPPTVRIDAGPNLRVGLLS
jgi:uncharacterized protein YbjT (DUF2867 family)